MLFSNSFRPMLERPAMDRYAGRLELIAGHAEAGQFGCFAETRSEGGEVEVLLWDRSFDGTDIHTEQLARQTFDAGDDQALVASSEFLADLQIWADRRNEQREADAADERDAAEIQAQLVDQRAAAGRELHEILAAHARPD